MKPTNELTITGRLTHDPEYQLIKDTTPLLTLKFAHSYKPYGKDEYATIFFKAKLWKDNADNGNRAELHKGDTVKVFGALRTEEYNGKTYLNLEFADLKDYEQATQKPETATRAENAQVDNPDVPF